MATPTERAVTIASGAATSDAERLGPATLVGLILPATFDGTSLSFTVCTTRGGTYVPLTDPDIGTAYTIAAAASKAYTIDPVLFLPWNYVKLVAGTNQATTDTVVTLLVRPV